jgi:hypothetical protein
LYIAGIPTSYRIRLPARHNARPSGGVEEVF